MNPKANSRLVVFIVSTGRTGTMALAKHYDRMENIVAAHEPAGSYYFNVLSNLYRAGWINHWHVASGLSLRRRKLESGPEPSVYIESNPWLHGCVSALDQAFPAPIFDTRLIHVTRHPASYLTSAINNGSATALKRLASQLVPFWVMRPRPRHRACFVAPRYPHHERLLWQWAEINRHLLEVGEMLGSRYYRVRFEDLFGETTALEKLSKWIGVNAVREAGFGEDLPKWNASTQTNLGPYNTWPAELKNTLDAHCSPLFQTLGYEHS